MQLGYGRELKQESSAQIAVRSLPFGFGEWLYDVIWYPKPISTSKATNQFILANGIPGSGKTNLAEMIIDEQIDKGLGGWEIDASPEQTLIKHTIGRLAEKGWPPEKVLLVDFHSPF